MLCLSERYRERDPAWYVLHFHQRRGGALLEQVVKADVCQDRHELLDLVHHRRHLCRSQDVMVDHRRKVCVVVFLRPRDHFALFKLLVLKNLDDLCECVHVEGQERVFAHDHICLLCFEQLCLPTRCLKLHDLLRHKTDAVEHVLMLKVFVGHVVCLHGEHRHTFALLVFLTVQDLMNLKRVVQLFKLNLIVVRKTKVFNYSPSLAVLLVGEHPQHFAGSEQDVGRCLRQICFVKTYDESILDHCCFVKSLHELWSGFKFLDFIVLFYSDDRLPHHCFSWVTFVLDILFNCSSSLWRLQHIL